MGGGVNQSLLPKASPLFCVCANLSKMIPPNLVNPNCIPSYFPTKHYITHMHDFTDGNIKL